MKKLLIILWITFNATTINAQQIDTVKVLDEVKITAAARKKVETELKMAVTVDEFLASSGAISFVKRGAYAWEPLLNNMSSERSAVTIDGMHIFGACTDKMDPVTSYLESNNLSAIDIKSGQEGSLHGATIAGSIDLIRKNTPFGLQKKLGGTYQTGFEVNNNQFSNLGNLSYSSGKFVADASIAFRKARNYDDGNKNEVNHSQYNKFNSSVGMAYKTGPLSSLRIDAIFDMAKDVGFPALPMDLSLSRALITSASYKHLFQNGILRVLDTKVYFNTIEHYMDDTKRPENLVHMDMPGWSTTYGLVSKASLKRGDYNAEVQLNAYQNLSIAEMRMYPQDRSKRTMFAYSWPWVTTRYASFAVSNSWDLSERSHLNLGGSMGWNYNRSRYSEFNQIFHPGTPAEKNRILVGLHAGYHLNISGFSVSIGTGYGQRAPSVSEAYGYYMYNSFDRYDYIGNPSLKNEISYEANAAAGFKNEKIGIEAKVNYFRIQNYIIGKVLNLGSPMNYQSIGVKGYTSLKHAQLINTTLNANYNILPHVHWKGALAYARATDDKDGNLPFIRPLTYQTSLHLMHKQLGFQTSFTGDLAQRNFSPEYGEDKTPAYLVWNLSADYKFKTKNCETTLQVGAENLLNEYYSTYADWGNIPRMGRNIFAALKLSF